MAFSQKKANQAIAFIEQLKHTKGIWHGVNFELLPWQRKIISDVFGTLKPDGYRQYNTAYVEICKKNGKSELAAAVALELLCADGEWGAEVYGCAADRAQASIVFDVAVQMIDQNPVLRKKVRPVMSTKRLIWLPTSSYYQVLSAEAFSKHGLNIHGVVFDELHAQPNRDLYDVMTKGSGDARTQPLFFLITTAGDDPGRTSIGWEVHKKAADILFGIRSDPTFYATMYGIEPEEKRVWSGQTSQIYETISWQDRAIWEAVNPSLGHTITLEKVEASHQSALGNAAEERAFRWLRLDEWVKFKATTWVPLAKWDESAGEVLPEENKAQAKIVRRIYTEFLDGKGANRIAKELEIEKVPKWDGTCKWYDSSIRMMLTNEKYKGDALLQKTYTVDFLSKKRADNTGQVPQYYVEDSHPAIIDKDVWEAVQLEMERRKNFAVEHGIQKLEYASANNPFAGRVICGSCGHGFGRKVWNSTDDRFRRIIWRCSGKYVMKGKRGCASKHIDDRVLYQAFVGAFNAMVENKNYFMGKWQERLKSGDLLQRYKAKQFIGIMAEGKAIDNFDIDLYFALVEKVTVYDGGRLIVSLLDGTEIECEI